MAAQEKDAVLSFLTKQGVLETRLRETSSGLREYVQDATTRMSLGLEDLPLLEILRSLQAQGMVTCDENVHPHDTSEYILSWRLVPRIQREEHKQMGQYISVDSVDLSGKTLVLRVDFNSPVNANGSLEHGSPSLLDTRRIDDHVRKTIAPLLKTHHRPRAIVLLAHQGRKGHDDFINLRPHYRRLAQMLSAEGVSAHVKYIWDDLTDSRIRALGSSAVASDEVLRRIRSLRDNSVLLLENVRFDDSESEESSSSERAEDYRDAPLIRMLSQIDNLAVGFDGFSVAHRAHPSVIGLAALGPLYAGTVVIQEALALSKALVNPEPPMLLVVGGAKVDDSMFSMEKFLENGMASEVLTGGIVGLVFLMAIGRHFNEPTMKNIRRATRDIQMSVDRARAILKRHGEKVRVPLDIAFGQPKAIATDDRETLHVDELKIDKLEKSMKEAGDIGVRTVGDYIHRISLARTIVMNGTMGHYELPCFEAGTEQLMHYTAFLAHDTGAHVLIGGGDTGAALGKVQARYARDVHVSSSGKAFLQVLSTGDINSLPAIRALAHR